MIFTLLTTLLFNYRFFIAKDIKPETVVILSITLNILCSGFCLLTSDFTAVIAKRIHPFPFRTRKLSSFAPMVLHGRLCGRVGHRRFFIKQNPLILTCQGVLSFRALCLLFVVVLSYKFPSNSRLASRFFCYSPSNSIMEKIAQFAICSLPFRSGNSIRKAHSTISPPSFSTSFTVAPIVPPVAIRSSMITTFSP